MKQYKYEILMFYSYYDRSGIARHLEDMAAKGWMLDRLGPWAWRYRRIEPKRLRFAVTYFPAASQFDPHPSAGQETFWDFCAEAGWEMAANVAQVQIFCTEQKNPIPIETDPAVELDTMDRSMKRGFLRSYWALLALSLIQLGMAFWRIWEDPIQQFSNPSYLSASTGYLPLLFLTSFELTRYYRWRRRARSAVEQGEGLPDLKSCRWLSFLILGFTGLQILLMFAANASSPGMLTVMGLMFLCMILIFFITHSVQKAMKKLNAGKRTNILVTYGALTVLMVGMFVGMTAMLFNFGGSGWLDGNPPAETYEYRGQTWDVYHDPIPLRIEDLMETGYDGWSTEASVDSTALVTVREYTQRPRMDALKQPQIRYEIVEVHVPALYDLCKQEKLTYIWYNSPEEYRDNYLPMDAAPWGADEVYQRHSYDGAPSNYYLLCWPHRIAEIHFYWTPTPEQMALTGEILGSA